MVEKQPIQKVTTKVDGVKICLLIGVVFTFSQFLVHYQFTFPTLSPSFTPSSELKPYMLTYTWPLKKQLDYLTISRSLQILSLAGL